MERIPEPELMEKKEQVISYDEADFSEGEVNLINQINYYLLKKFLTPLLYKLEAQILMNLQRLVKFQKITDIKKLI